MKKYPTKVYFNSTNALILLLIQLQDLDVTLVTVTNIFIVV